MSRDPQFEQDYRERTNQDAVEELAILKTGGICEVAARNPSVMEYMRHWEGRAEKAEAESERLRAALVAAAQELAAAGLHWAALRCFDEEAEARAALTDAT